MSEHANARGNYDFFQLKSWEETSTKFGDFGLYYFNIFSYPLKVLFENNAKLKLNVLAYPFNV